MAIHNITVVTTVRIDRSLDVHKVSYPSMNICEQLRGLCESTRARTTQPLAGVFCVKYVG